MVNAAIEAYDRGDSAQTAELLVESWARGISADRPTPALMYYVGTSGMMSLALMREVTEVRRSWSEAALEAAGAEGAVLSQLTWGFVICGPAR